MADSGKRGRKPVFTKEETKSRQLEWNRQNRRRTINIGEEIERWNELKTALKCSSHVALAKILLDRYLEAPLMSTPADTGVLQGHWTRLKARSGSESESLPSGIDQLSDGNQPILPAKRRKVMFKQPVASPLATKDPLKKSMSIAPASLSRAEPVPSTSRDPEPVPSTSREPDLMHDLSIHSENLEVSLDLTMVDDSEDPDYIPDISIINHALDTVLEETCPHDEIHDCSHIEDSEDVDLVEGEGTLVDDITTPSFVACEGQILDLANSNAITSCKHRGCVEQVSIRVKRHGSAIQLNWVCTKNHICQTWLSQPVTMKNIPLMNIKLAAGILFSGNNYSKIHHMLKVSGLGFISSSTFHRLQGRVLVPVIEEMWLAMRNERLQQLSGTEVIISGDGRMDSPGFCAKYCTYTVLNYNTKEILECVIVDKRQTALKSTNMEMLAFKTMLATLEEFGVIVKEVVTDAHMGIGAFMRQVHPNIKHSYDIWHGAKNLGKKLATASLERGSTDLKPWVGHVTNHFWYSSKTCAGSKQTLMLKLRGALHHTVNVHTWAFGECEHDPLTEDEQRIEWLEGDSSAHQKLRDILCSTRFTNSLEHYTNFRSTAELEAFQNHILAYASKRFAYSYDVYKARCYLAAIDYNKHLQRPVRKTKSGDIMYHRQFSKKAGHWTVKAVKEPKEFVYMEELMQNVVERTEVTSLCTTGVLGMDDPRRLAPTIAPVPPPPTSEIVAEKIRLSRFKE